MLGEVAPVGVVRQFDSRDLVPIFKVGQVDMAWLKQNQLDTVVPRLRPVVSKSVPDANRPPRGGAGIGHVFNDTAGALELGEVVVVDSFHGTAFFLREFVLGVSRRENVFILLLEFFEYFRKQFDRLLLR